MLSLFEKWACEPCINKIQLSANGSNRSYFRLQGNSRQCIAAYNANVRENQAFFHFAQQLRQHNINVPEIYAVSSDQTTYLQQDLGNVTLYSYLASRKASGVDISQPTIQLYRQAIDLLITIQDNCNDIDFSQAFPRPDFDRQAIFWDLNYFKYYFLQLFHIPFDEQLLENDFNTLADYLLLGDNNCFVHRDYQSRNIMLLDQQLFLIDFQGARRGSPCYDLAALLYSSKADIPDSIRQQLLDYYLDQRFGQEPRSQSARLDFRQRFHAFRLLRLMQAMGAYGYRGIIEKKEHFVKSIPYAVKNLKTLLQDDFIPLHTPHLFQVLQHVAQMPAYSDDNGKLLVSVFSFSYRSGIPFDKSGNGGGFVFDCRALPNPGLFDQYRHLNGRDKEVVDFFLQHPETETFLQSVRDIVGQSVKSYIDKGYTRLMVNFGCTGGRHRSVYCAEQIARYISDNFDCRVTLHHLEQSKL